jgi:hypothetical protein
VCSHTQHGDVSVGLLWRVCVQLAHVSPLVRQGHVGQRHPQLIVREVHQLEAGIFQGCTVKERETGRERGRERKGAIEGGGQKSVIVMH